uniref:F-box domain-containing protein n=1 Tax=Steinernema glaseri TaxID=37863 RepID=A0A1I7ZEX1_9BILA
MNAVPDVFKDATCRTLAEEDLKTLKQMSSIWSKTAATHLHNQRNLDVYINADTEGTAVRFGIQRSNGLYEFEYLPNNLCLKFFRRKVLPVLRSLALHCELDVFGSPSQYLTDSIFSGLFSCVQLEKISTANYGGKCPEFIEHQIRLGCVKKLDLKGSAWPDSTIISVRSFQRSPKLELLYLTESNVKLDVDMVTGFIERFLKGDLPEGVRSLDRLYFELRSLEASNRGRLERARGRLLRHMQVYSVPPP